MLAERQKGRGFFLQPDQMMCLTNSEREYRITIKTQPTEHNIPELHPKQEIGYSNKETSQEKKKSHLAEKYPLFISTFKLWLIFCMINERSLTWAAQLLREKKIASN